MNELPPTPRDARLDEALDDTFPASDPLPSGPRSKPRPAPNAELRPGERAPELVISTTSGDRFNLHDRSPEQFTMVVAYRGLHCPKCKTYLQTLEELHDRYRALGVESIAISMDNLERAERAAREWEIDAFPIAYGLSEDTARRWGLFLSDAIKDEEPRRFSEPGLFLVRADGALHFAAVQTMPFGRPDLEAMLDAIEFIEEEDYPARGRVAA